MHLPLPRWQLGSSNAETGRQEQGEETPGRGKRREDSIHQELESLAGTALGREMTEGEAETFS